MTLQEDIMKTAEIIGKSNRIVVFTGAGISTESGIPDFRSSGGLWSKYDPDVYANYFLFLKNPSPFWTMHHEVVEMLLIAKPNSAHYSIFELEKMGKLKAIITQNVDMLHQRAGSGTVNDVPIYELHGAFGELYCLKCNKKYNHDEIKDLLTEKEKIVPYCECGGVIKPTTILFGEQLPSKILSGAINACNNCDCFLMIGSSLLVTPANQMPYSAKNKGAKVIFINKEDTFMNNIADFFLKGKVGEILPKIINYLK